MFKSFSGNFSNSRLPNLCEYRIEQLAGEGCTDARRAVCDLEEWSIRDSEEQE